MFLIPCSDTDTMKTLFRGGPVSSTKTTKWTRYRVPSSRSTNAGRKCIRTTSTSSFSSSTRSARGECVVALTATGLLTVYRQVVQLKGLVALGDDLGTCFPPLRVRMANYVFSFGSRNVGRPGIQSTEIAQRVGRCVQVSTKAFFWICR